MVPTVFDGKTGSITSEASFFEWLPAKLYYLEYLVFEIFGIYMCVDGWCNWESFRPNLPYLSFNKTGFGSRMVSFS